MIVIEIALPNDRDVEAILELLANAAEDGVITEAYETKVEEI